MNYTDKEIREAYLKMLDMKTKKQKDSIDKKVIDFERELDNRSIQFKRKVQQEMQNQLDMIDKNTESFKKQVRDDAELKKQIIDENYASKRNSVSFNFEDVKALLQILNANQQ